MWPILLQHAPDVYVLATGEIFKRFIFIHRTGHPPSLRQELLGQIRSGKSGDAPDDHGP